MAPVTVALVSSDVEVRARAAEAFDHAPADWVMVLCDRPPDDADLIVAGPDVDVPGSVPYDPADPGAFLRNAGSRAVAATCTTVVSAVGGTGVTTIVLHLARALGRRDRCCVVDLAGGVGEALGMEGGARTWADLGGASLDHVALPVAGGFRTLLPPSGSSSDAGAGRALSLARHGFRHVVVDRGVAVDDALPDGATAYVCVIPPTRIAARRSKGLIAACASRPRAVVLNGCVRAAGATRGELEDLIEAPIALELPHIASLPRLTDEGRFADPRLSRWGRRIEELAVELAR